MSELSFDFGDISILQRMPIEVNIPQKPRTMQQLFKQMLQPEQTQSKQETKKQSTQKTSKAKVSATKQSTEQSLEKLVVNELKKILTGEKDPKESKLFEDLVQENERLKNQLHQTSMEYNEKMKELAQFTEKFNDAHSRLIGLFALMLGKSDLARHTNEHLFDKMRELILYYPVDVVPLAMRSLIVGYFAGKQAGIDTDGMSVGELIAMGENPEIVAKLSPKSVEFLGQLVDAMPQIFQMKVAPYKIMLDKLQNEAKILEMRQRNIEASLTKLEQNALRRMQLVEMLLNYLLTAQTRKEVAQIHAGARIQVEKMKQEAKEKEKAPLFIKPKDIRDIK
jgi:hypothetical protein